MLGGLHHIAISVAPDRWEHLRDEARDGRRARPMPMSGSSLYFSGPDGERLELIKDQLRRDVRNDRRLTSCRSAEVSSMCE